MASPVILKNLFKQSSTPVCYIRWLTSQHTSVKTRKMQCIGTYLRFLVLRHHSKQYSKTARHVPRQISLCVILNMTDQETSSVPSPTILPLQTVPRSENTHFSWNDLVYRVRTWQCLKDEKTKMQSMVLLWTNWLDFLMRRSSKRAPLFKSVTKPAMVFTENFR